MFILNKNNKNNGKTHNKLLAKVTSGGGISGESGNVLAFY